MALLKEKSQIIAWLEKYQVKNYTLLEDPSYGYIVDVEGHVNLGSKKLKSIDVKFNRVDNSFCCDHNHLMSLEGCPEVIGGSFYCNGNELTSLAGCPQMVPGNFACNNNKIKNIARVIIGGNFYCSGNQLTSLEYFPSVGGQINISDNADLGPYQHFTSYAQLKEILDIMAEKNTLDNFTENSICGKIHKL